MCFLIPSGSNAQRATKEIAKEEVTEVEPRTLKESKNYRSM